MALVPALQAKQAALRLNHARFAAELGISPAAWSLVRHGRRPVGKALVRGVLRRFPDMTSECLVYLRDEPPFLPATVTDSTALQTVVTTPA